MNLSNWNSVVTAVITKLLMIGYFKLCFKFRLILKVKVQMMKYALVP